ncbi:MarR family transcriptional regulator [Microtetraspora sp. NBRC 16547]|nr:MarR family transcriptional regulator [Microtetraspora sp. NBRC 16547]
MAQTNLSADAPSASSDQAVWSKVLALHARVERRLTQSLQRAHGIGLSEYRALADLAQADDGELRMQELADRIGLNQSSVTRLVGRLDAVGFAYRDVCLADGRGVYAVITGEGRERYNAARGTYAEALASEFDATGADPQLAGIVQALRNAL